MARRRDIERDAGNGWGTRDAILACAFVLRLLSIRCHSLCAAVIAFAAAGYFFIVPVYAVLYTYTPELYPTDLRSTATATFFFAISATQIVLPYLSGFLVEVNIDWVSGENFPFDFHGL